MQNTETISPKPVGILPDEYQLWEFYFLFQGIRNSYPPNFSQIAKELKWSIRQVEIAHEGLERKGGIYSERIADEPGRNIVALKMRAMDEMLYHYWDNLTVN